MTDPDNPNERMHPGDRLFAHAKKQRDARHRHDPAPVTDGANAVDPDKAHRYALRALDAEAETVAGTAEGGRNDQLNKSAFNLGTLVGAGVLNEDTVVDRLSSAAYQAGLEPGETATSLRSGLKAGIEQPRHLTLAPDPTPNVTYVDQLDPTDDVDAPTSSDLDQFWHANKWLTHVHDSAKARRCSPFAVLGVVLARVATIAPPAVVLPPIVGGQASLNLFVGLVGPSGSGKGAAERTAADCLYLPHIATVTAGSGEGIGHAYRARKRNGEQQVVNTAVLFSIPEIDTLSALGQRRGATLMPELRRGWSGESLGFAYADPTRRLIIEGHSYRMCLVAGIQPARAQMLLDDADGGTPQRFLWMPATDPRAPDTPPECPTPIGWNEPRWDRPDLRTRHSHGRMEIPVCETARATIDQAHLARARGQGDALDGHLLLSQLKAAAALALLDGRLEVTDGDWQLADVLTRWSTSVRAGVAATLRAANEARNVAQAEAEATRAEVVADRAAQAQHRRVCRHVMRRLADGEVVARSVLRRTLSSRDRGAFDAAIEALVSTGQIAQEGDGHATSFHRL